MSEVNVPLRSTQTAQESLMALLRNSKLATYQYSNLQLGVVVNNIDAQTSATRNTLLPITFTIDGRSQSAILRYNRPSPLPAGTSLEISNLDTEEVVKQKLRDKGVLLEEVILPSDFWVDLSTKATLTLNAKEYSLAYTGVSVISINNATELILLGDLGNIDANAFARQLLDKKIITQVEDEFTVSSMGDAPSQVGKSHQATVTTRIGGKEKIWTVAWDKKDLPSDGQINLQPGYNATSIKEALDGLGIYTEDINFDYQNNYLITGTIPIGAKPTSYHYKGNSTVRVIFNPIITALEYSNQSDIVPTDYLKAFDSGQPNYNVDINKLALAKLLEVNSFNSEEINTLATRDSETWKQAFKLSGDDVTVNAIIQRQGTLAKTDFMFSRIDISTINKQRTINYDFRVNPEALAKALYSYGILAKEVEVEFNGQFYPLYQDDTLSTQLTNEIMMDDIIGNNKTQLKVRAKDNSVFYKNGNDALVIELTNINKAVPLIGFTRYKQSEA